MDKNLKQRIITAIFYVIVLAGFFTMKVMVPDYGMLLFDILIVAFSLCGTFEILRALGDKVTYRQRTIVMIFSTATLLAYSISDTIYQHLRAVQKAELGYSTIVNYSPNIALVFFVAGVMGLFAMLVISYKVISLENTAYALLGYAYPSVFLLIFMGCNHMPWEHVSDLAVLYALAIGPFADTFAYFGGRLLGKKLPMKMSPNVSPNKTVVGGVFGLLGGAVGAVAIYFLYYGIVGGLDTHWTNILFFVAIGILAAAFGEFGDLVESAIKRKLDLKDMGNVLPGHGGVLDRIDSTLYTSLIICLVFVIRFMLIGS